MTASFAPRRRTSGVLGVLGVLGLVAPVGACAAPSASVDGASPPTDESFQNESDVRATSPFTVVPLDHVTSSVPVTFDVPESALGFTVVVEGETAAFVGLQTLINPEGVRVFDNFAAGGGTATPTAYGPGIASAVVPQTDGAEATPTPGRWTALFVAADATGMEVSTPLRASVRVQTTRDGAFHGGELDLHVWVPDGLVIQDPTPAHPPQ